MTYLTHTTHKTIKNKFEGIITAYPYCIISLSKAFLQPKEFSSNFLLLEEKPPQLEEAFVG